MSEPTAFALTHLFSQLIGRPVTFKQAAAAGGAAGKQVYGVYLVVPEQTPIIVKADLQLLSSFGGALVGLPDVAVKERIKGNVLDELLRDAVHEVLNVAATVISSQGRAVFQKMVTELTYLDGPCNALLRRPDHRSYFDVVVDGYQGGKFSVLAPFAPVKVVDG